MLSFLILSASLLRVNVAEYHETHFHFNTAGEKFCSHHEPIVYPTTSVSYSVPWAYSTGQQIPFLSLNEWNCEQTLAGN